MLFRSKKHEKPLLPTVFLYRPLLASRNVYQFQFQKQAKQLRGNKLVTGILCLIVVLFTSRDVELKKKKKKKDRGTWGARSAKHQTSAPVTISLFVSSSPTSGSVLTAQSLEPGFCVSLSLSPSPAGTLSLSLSKINI